MKILRILLSISETSGPYNQFSLPFHDSEDIRLIVLKSNRIDYSKTNLEVLDANGNIIKFAWLIFMNMAFRSFDVIHIHHANILPFTLFNLRKQILIVTLGTCYGNLKSRHRRFLLEFLRFSSALVCCSGAVYESVMNSNLGRYKSKILQIDHGINLDRIPPVKSKNPDVVVASRLIKSKNVDMVIEAFKSSTYNGELHIFGTGNEIDNLKTLAGEGNVHVHGLVTREHVLGRLSESSVFVSASESDGLPISVLEAAALDCHLVLIDSEPHLYLEESGLDCEIFGSEFELLDIFNQLASQSTMQLSGTSSQLVRERFSVETMWAKYRTLIKKLSASKTKCEHL